MSGEEFEYMQCGMCGFLFPQPQKLLVPGEPCPRCGDNAHRSSGSADASINIGIKLLHKVGARRKRWAVEETRRNEVRRDLGHAVGRHIIIDRRNNHYYERVVDKATGKEIHLVSEPLSKHTDHGDARKPKETDKGWR